MNKIAGRVVTRTATTVSGPVFRSATNGRFVSNAYGYSVQTVSDATKVAISLGF